MTELQKYFFLRLNIKERKNISFEDITEILQAMAVAVPFENLDIFHGTVRSISKENLKEKILMRKHGGLCYELNPILYYFLIDCGFDVRLVSGTVYDAGLKKWAVDKGHVASVLEYQDKLYLIETGFASFLPLAPVPFTGETVHSRTGDYRVRKEDTEKGTYVLEMRNNNEFLGRESSEEWRLAYAFQLDSIGEKELNQAQKVIVEHKDSAFNKGAIVVKLTKDGHMSLTQKSLTKIQDSTKKKEAVTRERYLEILSELFGIVR
ncbi:arylamine N-acetyltransferase family protein [Bacillus cereus]|uniref:N-hydroxyarylamine O-acetyltransferase n=1 Tax=Bacillus cereus VD184 TaxID=1053242 RepID=A0A9W5R0T3_BACCE|nr:arylamine N-acetyltransferase [Bacillus cereus]EOQ01473.1 hypothetical protein IKC_06250 [Bacillus cereus VD184]